jgi:hypothetical protein
MAQVPEATFAKTQVIAAVSRMRGCVNRFLSDTKQTRVPLLGLDPIYDGRGKN